MKLTKVISLTLCAILTIGCVAAFTSSVSAASAMATSSDGIKFLKKEEGFARIPYWDYSQWSVGYGTRCPDNKLEEYKTNGITEKEAHKLMLEHVVKIERVINTKLVGKYKLRLTQQQYDALVSFSYNVGTGWIETPNSTITKAIRLGLSDSELVRAFGLWCKAGGKILPGLVQRRMREANMYLNRDYTTNTPEDVGYVYCDPNGGTISYFIQGFVVGENTPPSYIPTCKGHVFVGWYTKPTGGEKVTSLTKDLIGRTLYAHWDTEEGVEIDPMNPMAIKVTSNSAYFYDGPGTAHNISGEASVGDKLLIDKVTSADFDTWGRCDKGWICLKYTNYAKIMANGPEDNDSTPNDGDDEQSAISKKTYGVVKLSSGCLRVRSGPGTNYGVVGQLLNGDKVEILEQKEVGTMKWCRIEQGWICSDYVELEQVEQDSNKQPVSIIGTVIAEPSLRIRKGPGVNFDAVGFYANGTKIHITELKVLSETTWGKTEKGWVSMSYVQQSITRTIDTACLRIREDAGTNSKTVGYLYYGTRVEIVNIKVVDGAQWGKIDKGWISLDYTK